jgi:DNA-binding Lrp family transcriptional regulator
MLELKEKEKEVLRHFRKNAREALTLISRKTNVPVSTIFDKLKRYEEQFIKKHTTLIDFQKLGYMTRANILLKANMKGREALKKTPTRPQKRQQPLQDKQWLRLPGRSHLPPHKRSRRLHRNTGNRTHNNKQKRLLHHRRHLQRRIHGKGRTFLTT